MVSFLFFSFWESLVPKMKIGPPWDVQGYETSLPCVCLWTALLSEGKEAWFVLRCN